jgi:hypothetical protein
MIFYTPYIFFRLLFFIGVVQSLSCSWNYRFDSIDNHFNIVYPDKNAVYFAMIIPYGTANFTISSNDISHILPHHPIAKYFSVQIYTGDNAVESIYHYTDAELISVADLGNRKSNYKITIALDTRSVHLALFRIYGSLFDSVSKTLQYWSGLPPRTFIDGRELFVCDIDYEQQGNIYTNISTTIITNTGTICIHNEKFIFMEAPPGSLMNSDANYMIACIQPNTSYNVTIRMPSVMCSLGTYKDDAHPFIDESYDLRYASLSLISTTAPRPTIETFVIPCDTDVYSITILANETIPLPGLLYRQLLPNAMFDESIENAKHACYDYYSNQYDYLCIEKIMGAYYPQIQLFN